MRQYLDQETHTLIKVVCNQCGRELKLENGIVQEGVLPVEARWGYFSRRDGEMHRFDLCEDCYERLVGSFRIPADREEMPELL